MNSIPVIFKFVKTILMYVTSYKMFKLINYLNMLYVDCKFSYFNEVTTIFITVLLSNFDVKDMTQDNRLLWTG